jgi:hypothetical protein
MKQAPASFCKPHVDDSLREGPDAIGMFLRFLVKRHPMRFLHSRSWHSVTSGKPATEIYNSAVPLLSLNAERALLGFDPTVVDNVLPICIPGAVATAWLRIWYRKS